MPEVPPALLAVARAMAVDAWMLQAVRALRDADVQAIVLKGPALAEWLYDDDAPRTYGDVDVLVPLDRLDAARDVLRALGYREGASPPPPPGTIEHAAPWFRLHDGAVIDLHHSISGPSIEPRRVWHVLAERSVELDLRGHALRVPDIPSRALIVALHAAQHGPGVPQPQEDLRRAIALDDDEIWRQAAWIAGRLDATAQFADGLGLSPEGTALVERLGLSGDGMLAAAPTALGFQRLATTSGTVPKLAIIARELVPSPRFLRWWRPWTRRGRLALAAGYAYRMGWLIAHAPSGWSAWRAARRAPRPPGPPRA
jgi:hypothetical protein